MKGVHRFAFVLMLGVALAGCGYTAKSLLPADVKSVYVPPVKNSINLSDEVTDKNPFRVYRPGLEVEITNALINRFIFDGNLKIASAEKADAVLETSLVDYRRDALRYTSGDDVQEYRLSITIEVTLVRSSDHKNILPMQRLVGDATFFLSGSRAISEEEASAKAVEDLTRRVVDKIIETW